MKWTTFANAGNTSSGRHLFEAVVDGGRYQLAPVEDSALNGKYKALFIPAGEGVMSPVVVCEGLEMQDCAREVYRFEKGGRAVAAPEPVQPPVEGGIRVLSETGTGPGRGGRR